MLFMVVEHFKDRDPALLQEWIKNWGDLVDFEVVPVVTSAEMQKLFALAT